MHFALALLHLHSHNTTQHNTMGQFQLIFLQSSPLLKSCYPCSSMPLASFSSSQINPYVSSCPRKSPSVSSLSAPPRPNLPFQHLSLLHSPRTVGSLLICKSNGSGNLYLLCKKVGLQASFNYDSALWIYIF